MSRLRSRLSVGLSIAALLMILFLAGSVQAATLVVANKAEGTVSLLALPSGKVVATLPVGDGPHEVAVSPDGRLALVANYGLQVPGQSVTVVDVPGARVAKTIDLEEYRRPHGLAWLSDKKALVTVEENQSLLELDVAGGRVGRAIPTSQEVSHMVAVLPDGSRAFVANIQSGSVAVLDLKAGRRLKVVPTGPGAEGIAVTPDGREVWVANREAGTLSVLDAGTLAVAATLPAPGYPIRVKITPDGRRALVTCAQAGDLAVFDVAGRRLETRVPLTLPGVPRQGWRKSQFGESSSVPVGLVVEPGGRRAYVAHSAADRVTIVDLGSLKPILLLRAGQEPDGMGYSPLDAKPRK